MAKGYGVDLLMIALLCIFAGFVTYDYLQMPLWADEAWRANVLSQANFPSSVMANRNAPLDFGFSGLTKLMISIFGNYEWSLRIVPFTAYLACVVLSYLLTLRASQSRLMAALAAMFIAASYHFRTHAIELKPMTLQAFSSLLIIYLTWRYLEKKTARNLTWLILSTLAVFFTTSSVIMVFCSLSLIFFVDLRNRNLGRLKLITLWGALLGAGFIFYYLYFLKPQVPPFIYKAWVNEFPKVTSLSGYVEHGLTKAYHILQTRVFGEFYTPVEFQGLDDWWKTLATPFISLILISIGAYELRSKRKDAAILYLFLGPIFLVFAASLFSKYPFGANRSNLFLFAPLTILAFAGFARIMILKKSQMYRFVALTGLGALVYGAFPYVSLLKTFEDRTQIYYLGERVQGDEREWYLMSGMKQAMREISSQAKENDLIIPYSFMASDIVTYYSDFYDGFGEGRPLRVQTIPFKGVQRMGITEAHFEQLIKPNRKVWLVFDYGSFDRKDSLKRMASAHGVAIHEKKYSDVLHVIGFERTEDLAKN